MEKTKIEVSSVTVRIGKKELTLSLDEVRDLRQALDKAFEKETIVKEIHHHNDYWWNRPHITWNTSLTYPTYTVGTTSLTVNADQVT